MACGPGLTPDWGGMFILCMGSMAHGLMYHRLTSAPVLQIAWLMVVFPLFMFLSFQVSFSALTWVVPL